MYIAKPALTATIHIVSFEEGVSIYNVELFDIIFFDNFGTSYLYDNIYNVDLLVPI